MEICVKEEGYMGLTSRVVPVFEPGLAKLLSKNNKQLTSNSKISYKKVIITNSTVPPGTNVEISRTLIGVAQ